MKDDGVLVDWNGVLCARSGVGRLGDGSIELSINVFIRELVLKNVFLDFLDYFFFENVQYNYLRNNEKEVII